MECMAMERQLLQCVNNSLNLGLYENARFLAERLVAACPTEDHKLLLATCYRHCNQGYRAVHLLKGSTGQSSRYLAALCCIELRRNNEAEALLLGQGEAQVPNGAAGWYLLGRISRLTNNLNRAAECYVKALQKDCMLWVAFSELCMLGKPELTAEFANAGQLAAVLQSTSQQQDPVQQQHQHPHISLQACQQQDQQQQQQIPNGTPTLHSMSSNHSSEVTPEQTMTDGDEDAARTGTGPGAFAAGHTPHMLSFSTPSPQAAAAAAPPPVPQKGGLFPGFPEPPAGNRTPTLGKHKQPAGAGLGPTPAAGAPSGRGRKASKAAGRLFAADGSATPRRSARLAAAGTDTVTPATASPAPLGQQDPNQQLQPPRLRQQQQQHHPVQAFSSTLGSENAPAGDGAAAAAAGMHALGHHVQQSQPEAKAQQQQQQDQLLSVFLPLRLALHHLSQYKCRDALNYLSKLPQEQLNSPGVLLLMGRCLYELVDYRRAAEAFEAARAADPMNLEAMEYYSTVLWHLKRDVELAHLAQHAVSVDRLAPEAWCVAGNCYSLQREHETAVSLFKRALQLQPHMAYAATLMGHEYLAGEDLAAATTAYQHALRSDGRHYNALYGLGQIYMKQEKYEAALKHFSLAAHINPNSSVLRCCCGTAFRRMNRLEDALKQLKIAIAIDSRNPLARFEAAGVLASLERHEEALVQLKQLTESVPRESAVHFMMGKLYKRLGQTDKALAALNIALDLKPSATDRAAIKAAIDKVHMSEDEEEEEL